MTDSRPKQESLRESEPTPISQLNPDLPDQATRVIDGVITITWPFSIVTKSIAFILAERDARLRREKGQVRVRFHGGAAKAISEAAIGGGDEIRVSLDGVKWEKNEMQTQLAGSTLEWQIEFTNRLLLGIQKVDSQETSYISLDLPESTEAVVDDEALNLVSQSRSDDSSESPNLMVSKPRSPEPSISTKRPAATAFDSQEYSSPAFIKRARVSYGALFEGGFDIFNEDDGPKAKSRRRTRFSMNAPSWRYSSQSPSPEPSEELEQPSDEQGEPNVNHERQVAGASPVASSRPPMVDEGCQTMDVEFTPMSSVQVFAESRLPVPFTPSTPTPLPRTSMREPESTPQPRASMFGQEANSGIPAPSGFPMTYTPSFDGTPVGFDFATSQSVLYPPATDVATVPEANNSLKSSTNEASRSEDYPASFLENESLPSTGMDIHPSLQDAQAVSHDFSHPLSQLEEPQYPQSHPASSHTMGVIWATVGPSAPFPFSTGQNNAHNPMEILDSSSPIRERSPSEEQSESSKQREQLEVKLDQEMDASAEGSASDGDSVVSSDSGEEGGDYKDGGDKPGDDYDLRNYDSAREDDDEQDDSEEDLEPDSSDVEAQVMDLEAEEESDEDGEDLEDYQGQETGEYDGEGYNGSEAKAVGNADSEDEGEYYEDEDEYDEDEEDEEEEGDGASLLRPAVTPDPVFISLLSDSEDESEPDAEQAPGEKSKTKSEQKLELGPEVQQNLVPMKEQNFSSDHEQQIVSGPEQQVGPEPGQLVAPEPEPEQEQEQMVVPELEQQAVFESEQTVTSEPEQQSSPELERHITPELEQRFAPEPKPEQMVTSKPEPEPEQEQEQMVAPELEQQAVPESEQIFAPGLEKQVSPESEHISPEPKQHILSQSEQTVMPQMDQNLVAEPKPEPETQESNIEPNITGEEVMTAEPSAELEERENSKSVTDQGGILTEDASQYVESRGNPDEMDIDGVGITPIDSEMASDIVQATGEPEPAEDDVPANRDSQAEFRISESAEANDTEVNKATSEREAVPTEVAPHPAENEGTEKVRSGSEVSHIQDQSSPNPGDIMDVDAKSESPVEEAPTKSSSSTIVEVNTSTTKNVDTENHNLTTETRVSSQMLITTEMQTDRAPVPEIATDEALVESSNTMDMDNEAQKEAPAETCSKGKKLALDASPIEDSASQLMDEVVELTETAEDEDIASSPLLTQVSPARSLKDMEKELHTEPPVIELLAHEAAEQLPTPDDTQQAHHIEEMQDDEDASAQIMADFLRSSPIRPQSSASKATQGSMETSQDTEVLSTVRSLRSRGQKAKQPSDSNTDPSLMLAKATKRAAEDSPESIPYGTSRVTRSKADHADPSLLLARSPSVAPPSEDMSVGSPTTSTRMTRSKAEYADLDPSIRLAQSPAPSSEKASETSPASTIRVTRSKADHADLDPSIRLAQSPAPSSEKASETSPASTIRVTRSKADHADPSLQLAKARQSRRQATTPERPRSMGGSSRGLQGAETPDSVVTATISPSVTGSFLEDDNANAVKLQLVKSLRISLPEYISLKSLRHSLNKTADILAIATATPPQPHRPKGARGYMMTLNLTDPSVALTAVSVAHIFRPHQTSLPTVQAGDIVLLRRFQVVAMKGRGHGIRAGDASTWAVFEQGDEEMLPQIKGPPMEVTRDEVKYAEGLKKWWNLLDDKALDKIERANRKVADAGKEDLK